MAFGLGECVVFWWINLEYLFTKCNRFSLCVEPINFQGFYHYTFRSVRIKISCYNMCNRCIEFLGFLPREFWVFFCREPNFASLDLNKNSYHKNVTIALQAFSCLQAVSPCLTPALMPLDSKFNILTLLSYCMLAIWGPGNFIDYVFKYHIVCITNIFTNRVKNRVIV